MFGEYTPYIVGIYCTIFKGTTNFPMNFVPNSKKKLSPKSHILHGRFTYWFAINLEAKSRKIFQSHGASGQDYSESSTQKSTEKDILCLLPEEYSYILPAPKLEDTRLTSFF